MNPTFTSRLSIRPLVLGGAGVLALGVVAGCSLDVELGADVDGSGTATTLTYEFDDFDAIKVGNSFDVEVLVQPGPASAEVTVDDNLADFVEASVSRGELEIDFGGTRVDPEVQPTARVTVPSLNAIEAEGAAAIDVADLESETLSLDASGASSVRIIGSVETLRADLSGASNTRFEGEVDWIELEASGASEADFGEIEVRAVEVKLSGASTARLGQAEKIEGKASGASTLWVDADADVDVSLSGASTLVRDAS